MRLHDPLGVHPISAGGKDPVWLRPRVCPPEFFSALGILYGEFRRSRCTPKGAYGNTAFWEGFWEGSGKGSGEGVLRRVLRRGSSSLGFTVRKGSEKGSQKGFWEGSFQKVPRTPPCRVRPLRRVPYRRSRLKMSIEIATRPQLGPLFVLKFVRSRGFGARFLQPFPRSLVTVKYYSNTKMAVNSR